MNNSKKLNLYILTQDSNTCYDVYDSVVVAAENEEEATKITPDEKGVFKDNSTWASDISEVKCKLIGIAEEDIKKGVVHASFNAG